MIDNYMLKLVNLFSHLSNFIFNSYSYNKFYYVFTANAFFRYKISEEEYKTLSENKIFDINREVNGYYDFYLLLNKIYNVIAKENFENDYDFEIRIKEEAELDYRIKQLKTLYNKYNGQELFDYIIHGSYADKTATEFSDVDDIVFIKEEVYKNYTKFKATLNLLSKLNLKYQWIDFTQHHGHWIFTYFDKYFYDNYIMPTVVYRDAIAIGNEIELKLKIDNSKQVDYKAIINKQIKRMREHFDKVKHGSINLFELKEFVSGISLIVPLCFQINGKLLSKKEAIENTNEMFSSSSLAAIEWSSKIRRDWKQINNYKLSKKIIKLLSNIIRNRRLLQEISNKLPLKVKGKQILYLNDEIIERIDTLIKEIEQYG